MGHEGESWEEIIHRARLDMKETGKKWYKPQQEEAQCQGERERAGSAGVCYIHLLHKPRSQAAKAREGSWGGYEPETPLALRLR